MDAFVSLAKEGYKAYQASHSNSNESNTGGQEYDTPHPSHPPPHQPGQQGAPHYSGQQGGGNHGPRFDHDEVVRTAGNHGPGDPSLYANAMGHVSNNQHEHHDAVDENAVHEAHNKAYNQNAGSDLSANAMGGAAAMQVLKSFTSGGGGSGGGGSQSQLISMAMAEAGKLFDHSGGAASGNKQDAVNGAAMTVMKLLVQSKLGGAGGGGGGGGGGGSSGGMGSLMGLASKFMS